MNTMSIRQRVFGLLAILTAVTIFMIAGLLQPPTGMLLFGICLGGIGAFLTVERR